MLSTSSVCVGKPAFVGRRSGKKCLALRGDVQKSVGFERETAKQPGFAGKLAGAVVGVALGASVFVSGASARLDSVNRPDLLPSEPTTVIDVAGFLTKREEQNLSKEIASLEADTGVRLRVLAQSYPETPGLAVKEFWKVDEDTVVFVADPTFGGILNFNVGQNIDFQVPRNFWSRLTGKFGNKFYWREKGENVAIINAVGAIDSCLREEPSRNQCNTINEVVK
ncbi:hypothetical protein BSKO_12121 [Bryopsis sp. KO-2023]|nr:hypothetical protein BSKO_12121 [Bryopsis sp. KO-2023]